MNHFKKAVQLAETVGNTVIACSAELGAASALLSVGDHRRARTHLDRAAKRCETPNALADQAMLEGEYHLRRHQPELAVPHLERAAQALTELLADRNAARAQLWLAEAHLAQQNPCAADSALENAATIWRALGADTILSELPALPNVLQHFNNDPNHLARGLYDTFHRQTRVPAMQSPAWLHLYSLGISRLELDGTTVRLELRRALEVLVYLLRVAQANLEGSSIQNVLRDLFPDVPQRQARLYFHRVRYELEKKIPSLGVLYNATNRTYALRCDFEITWDVLEFEAALAEQSPVGVTRAFKLFGGGLMPNVEGEWLESERATLNAHALKSGLEWCKTWFERQQYGRCVQLATRLLEIDPLDESLNEHLMRATRALEGRVAARQTVKRLRQRFETELGTLPVTLEPDQHGLEKQ